jgi:hypothetical protein
MMKIPRVSITSVMAAVVVVAIDCMTIQSVDLHLDPPTRILTLIVLGALPMANVLAIGITLLIRGRGQSRPFLMGFDAAGAVALLGWIGYTIARPDQVLVYLGELEPMMIFAGRITGLGQSPAWNTAMIVGFVPALLLVLELILGIAGGLLVWRFRRRAEASPVEGSAARPISIGSLLALVFVVAIPSMAVEGVRRTIILPMNARLNVGSEAVVDLKIMKEIVVKLSNGPALKIPDGAKVRIEGDEAPISPGGIMVAPSNEMMSGDLREVQVTLLDGPGTGGSTTFSRMFLRPRR